VASEKGQQIIREFGKAEHGEGLYNDAVYAKNMMINNHTLRRSFI
jgi:hypothetical protein